MDEPHAPPASLSSGDDEQLLAYQSISKLAMASLLVGAASALALTWFVWWVLPPLAIVLGYAALRAISASEGALIGRRAATLGIALAILFAGMTAARYGSRAYVLRQRAKAAADTWFELFRSPRRADFLRAYEWTLPLRYRQSPEIDLVGYYDAHPEAAERIDQMLRDSPAFATVRQSPGRRLSYVGVAILRQGPGFDAVVLDYELAGDGDSPPTDVRIHLVRRKNPKSGQWSWRIIPHRPDG